MKLVIIGGVAGGASAAARARRLDEKAEIILLERGAFISFANCGLPYYVGGVITDEDDNYLTSLTGMPQTRAVAPFKAPIDESKIMIGWQEYTDEWGNKFPDGESYSLIYPEVTIPESAYYVPLIGAKGEVPYAKVRVRLESTIGIYGTGLLDAISDSDLKAEYVRQEQNAQSRDLQERRVGQDLWDDHPSAALYLCPEPRPVAGCGGCQCHLEHHQRDPPRPPLPLSEP